MPTFAQSEKGYGNMWDKAKVVEAMRPEVLKFVNRAQANRSAYEEISRACGAPWHVVAAIHMRESSMNFKGHLHNGDPLTARTTHVPKGRPKVGNPPFTFEASAVDALTVAPHDMRKVGRWSTERVLYELEKYNGWGYLGKTNSPYLWAKTNLYSGGKFVADGKYDASAFDTQVGCVAFLKVLAEKVPDLATKLASDREATPPEDVVKEEEKRATATGKKTTTAGGIVTGGTGGSDAVGFKLGPTFYIGVGVGLALLTVGIVLWVKGKMSAKQDIQERWA